METIVLTSDTLRLEILPECGGKIRSLVDLRSGCEWMWENPTLPQRRPEYGQKYETFLDTGGWDELFPTVAPCEIEGISVPDHGDLVSLPWEVTGQGASLLTMRCRARSLPVPPRG